MVRAVGRKQVDVSAVETHAVQVLKVGVPRLALVTHEGDRTALFIDLPDVENIPGTVGDLTFQLTRARVV